MSVTLSPRYGVNPTIPVCFWCGEERNEVALMGRISRKKEVRNAWGGTSNVVESDIEAPRNMVLDYEPCDECRKYMDMGFTVMEATTAPNSATNVEIQSGVYPTGRYAVLKMDAAVRIFQGIDTSKKKAFVDDAVFKQMFPDG